MERVPGCYIRPAQVEPLAQALTAALRHGPAPEAREAVLKLDLDNVARRVNAVYERVIAARRARAGLRRPSL